MPKRIGGGGVSGGALCNSITIAEVRRARRPIQSRMNRAGFFLLFVSLLAGCAQRSASVRSAAMPIATVPLPPVNQPGYILGCPDLLEVRFAGHPAWDVQASVDVDGCLPLGPGGRPRVEALMLDQAKAAIAQEAHLDAARVSLALVDPSAKFLTVHGPEANCQQMLVYRGPERVVELLQRTGTLKPGCTDPRDISVVRPNVARGAAPELFHVDFEAIFLDNDDRTNVTLQSGDQVYIGETRRSSFSRLLPNWMKPLYKRVFKVRV